MNKEQLQRVVDELPAEISLDELMERLIWLQRFEQGRDELAQGKAISHEDVGSRLEKWLK